MKSVSKIVFYIFILGALLAAGWGYYKLKENKEPTIIVTEHISKSASIIIQTSNVSEFVTQYMRQNLIWNSLKNDTLLKSISNNILFLDSLMALDTDIAELFRDNTLYTCFFNDNTECLILLKAKQQSNKALLYSFFESHFQACSIANNITGFELSINKQTWFVAYKNGLLYLSPHKKTIEESIQLKKEQSLAVDVNYLTTMKANGNEPHLLYLNNQSNVFFKEALLSSHVAYHLDGKPNNISLNGFAINSEMNELFLNQQPTVIRIFQQLPQNPVSIVAVSVSNPLLYQQQFNKSGRISVTKKEQIAASWKTLSDSILYNVEQEFLENIEHEITSAYYEKNNELFVLSAIKLNDDELMSNLLKLVSDSVTTINDEKNYHIKKEYQSIFSLLNNSEITEYATITDGNLILANQQKAFTFYSESKRDANLISKDKEMMTFVEDNFSEACHVLHYNKLSDKPSKYIPWILKVVPKLTLTNALSHVAYTAKLNNNLWQVRLNAVHKSNQLIDDHVSNKQLWQLEIDSIVETTVYPFTNHTTQENELCFQTINKELYLINTTGNVLWKKKINESITSKVYTVDIFKNGKLQLLFNTANYLHLIDRNGNYVQGFPIKVPAKITSQLTLLDYDNNKDYRLLIACADKRIYNYSIYGIKTDGFVPFKTADIVELPIKYIKLGLSDYLISIDVEGKIMAFSRKGEERIELTNKTITHLNQFDILEGNSLNSTKLVYVDDKDNLLNKISLSDKKETLKLGDEISNFYSKYLYFNEDKQLDVICSGDGSIHGYDLFSNKLFEYFSETSVYNDVQVIKNVSQQYLIAYDKAGSKIDVINASGKLIKSINGVSKTPLVIDLYKNNTFYIIYNFKNTIRCEELML